MARTARGTNPNQPKIFGMDNVNYVGPSTAHGSGSDGTTFAAKGDFAAADADYPNMPPRMREIIDGIISGDNEDYRPFEEVAPDVTPEVVHDSVTYALDADAVDIAVDILIEFSHEDERSDETVDPVQDAIIDSGDAIQAGRLNREIPGLDEDALKDVVVTHGDAADCAYFIHTYSGDDVSDLESRILSDENPEYAATWGTWGDERANVSACLDKVVASQDPVWASYWSRFSPRMSQSDVDKIRGVISASHNPQSAMLLMENTDPSLIGNTRDLEEIIAANGDVETIDRFTETVGWQHGDLRDVAMRRSGSLLT